MPQPKQKQPRPDPDGINEISISLGSVLVGFVLLVLLVWSIYVGEMTFAYLNASLLTVLAIGNHAIGV